MRVHELIIEQKVREMILYGYTALRQLPRAERHVLSAEIRSAMLHLLKLVITAAKRHHKKTTLTDMDVELAALQSQIRLAKELGYLPMKKYQLWTGMNVEIGRLLGGWLRAQQ